MIYDWQVKILLTIILFNNQNAMHRFMIAQIISYFRIIYTRVLLSYAIQHKNYIWHQEVQQICTH